MNPVNPAARAVLDLLASHSTVRSFADEPIHDDLIRACVASAQQASTSSNVQAYSLLRITDPDTRQTLIELTGGQPQVAAGAFFVVCADQRRHRLVAADADAPFAVNLETFLVAVIDASLFAQNLTVAFEACGLGVCYIGGLRNELPSVDQLLELPDGVLPLYGLCAGVPAQQPDRKPRLPLSAIYFEDRYPSDAALRESIADYDARMAAYYEERGASGRNWSGGLWRKFRAPARPHLASFFRSKGASLD